MQIKSFSIDKEKEINEFLKEHSTKLIENGVSVFQDRVVLMYDDLSDQERSTQMLVRQAKNNIIKMYGQILQLEMYYLYWSGQSLKGEKSAQNKVVETSGQIQELRAQVKYTKDVIDNLEKGEFYKE